MYLKKTIHDMPHMHQLTGYEILNPLRTSQSSYRLIPVIPNIITLNFLCLSFVEKIIQ